MDINFNEFIHKFKENKSKLHNKLRYSFFKELFLIVIYIGISFIYLGFKFKYFLLSFSGVIIFFVGIFIMIQLFINRLSRKITISYLLANIGELIQGRKNEPLVKNIKYLDIISKDLRANFFEKNSQFFNNLSRLAKRINYSIQNNTLEKFVGAKITKLGWLVFNEDEKIYYYLNDIIKTEDKELEFKKFSDNLKNFITNKYVKFVFFEIVIILLVITARFLFPDYVDKGNVFWAIIFLTSANLTINFVKK